MYFHKKKIASLTSNVDQDPKMIFEL